VLGYAAMTITAKRLQPDDEPKLTDLILGAAMLGLVLGRVWYMIGTGTNPLTHLGDFILLRAGVSTIGAVVGFVLMLILGFRSGSPRALALVGVPTLVGLAGWELGCLIRGTCLGTEAAFGLTSVAGVTRHPIGVYTGLLFLLTAFIVWRAQRGGYAPWTGFFAFGMAGLARAATEPLRLHFGVGLLWWYVGAAVTGLLFAWLSRSQQLASNQS
jgi:prolipoprotein diacylglyceryltransferase